jgi:membrane protein YdbS with pleckstrin-like domain
LVPALVAAFVVLVLAVIGGSILVNHHAKPRPAAMTGTLVRGNGFTIRLPVGWRQVPTGASAFHRFVASFARISPDAAAQLVATETTPLARHFGLLAVRETTAPVLISVNLLTGEGGGRTVASLSSAAKLQLDAIGAADVVTTATRLPAGPALLVSYRLTSHANGRRIAVDGSQYYIVGRRGVTILTLTTVSRAADEAAFDQMAASFTEG